jgi:uncharacterized protein with HEPN domain
MPPLHLTADLMLEVIDRLKTGTDPLTRAEFVWSEDAQDIPAYRLRALGDLAGKLPPDLLGRYPHVPWAKIARLPNRLAHEYFDADANIFWDIATDHIAPLAAACRAIIAASEQP